MLVVGGRPLELDAHLARLHDSVQELFGVPAPDDARELVLAEAGPIELGRLRVTVAPNGGDGVGATVGSAPVDRALVFPGWERAVTLRALVVADGLGPHKWADRRLLEQAEADPAGPLALIVDSDGSVLEGSRANVFAVLDGAVVTPPTDGRLLPGNARPPAMEMAASAGIAVHERALTLDELRGADEAFLTGSVRGIEAVRALEGKREWAAVGPVTAAIAERLRRFWLGDA
jgi:para-aminobenzoate synthetase/4-amino-4-deoxychorismate lyase